MLKILIAVSLSVLFITESSCHPTLLDLLLNKDNEQRAPASDDVKLDPNTETAPSLSLTRLRKSSSIDTEAVNVVFTRNAEPINAVSQQELGSQEILSRLSRSPQYDYSSEERFDSREAIARLYRNIDRAVQHKCYERRVPSPCCCGWNCCRCTPTCQWYSRVQVQKNPPCPQRTCLRDTCDHAYWQRCQETYHFTPRPWRN